MTKESALRWEAGKTIPGAATFRQQAGPEESRGRLEAGQPQRGGGGGASSYITMCPHEGEGPCQVVLGVLTQGC